MRIVRKYIKSFAAESAQYKSEGNSILQPENIPICTLQKIAHNELEKMQNYPAEHKLYIVTGRIGGGKTTFVEQNCFNKLFYIPDSDDIKPLLPGYKERGSSYVHKASFTINSVNLREALKKGINTVLQTATTFDNIDDIISEAKDYNYNDIILIHIDTKEDIAIERAIKRGEVTGRKVNPDIIKERTYIDRIVPEYKIPSRGVSHLIVYDNNGNTLVKVEDINLTFAEELTYVTESDD
ncbi:MAG: zeta toxin family protein [bacterium]|nr:zeta toxin family protein [bacterium]